MDAVSLKKLKRKIILIFPASFLFMAGILFPTAGSFEYWEAWAFCEVMMISAFFIMLYFIKKRPEFLERRLKYKEKEIKQKNIIKAATILFFLGFFIPGLDYRFGWSNVPVWLVIVSDIIIVGGFYMSFLAFKENPYAARTVEVFKDHKVIDTGPYSIVRHPMYAGVIPMYFFMATALGSYWALIPFSLTCIVVVIRALDEEKILKRDLPGYKEYCKKVPYHLIPFIW